MNKKQQIKEMAEITEKALEVTSIKMRERVQVTLSKGKCYKSSEHVSTMFEDMATALYEAGYRKQSNVAREFVEKLIKAFYEFEQDNYKAGRKESAFGVMCAGHLVDEVAKEFGVEE